MSTPNLNSRFSDPRDNIGSLLVKAEDDLIPFNQWPSLPGEMISSTTVDTTADPQNRQQTMSARRHGILEEQSLSGASRKI